MPCNDCEVRIEKVKKFFTTEVIGGLTLVGGAFAYFFNIHDAYIAQNVEGVSALWSSYFILLNLIYCRLFYINELHWSFWGGVALTMAEIIYFLQIVTY